MYEPAVTSRKRVLTRHLEYSNTQLASGEDVPEYIMLQRPGEPSPNSQPEDSQVKGDHLLQFKLQ